VQQHIADAAYFGLRRDDEFGEEAGRFPAETGASGVESSERARAERISLSNRVVAKKGLTATIGVLKLSVGSPKGAANVATAMISGSAIHAPSQRILPEPTAFAVGACADDRLTTSLPLAGTLRLHNILRRRATLSDATTECTCKMPRLP
jgi:hypothetical protein